MPNQNEFSSELVIQYTIVGLILLGVCVWIIWKIARNNKKASSGSCCGCAIADSCKKVKKK